MSGGHLANYLSQSRTEQMISLRAFSSFESGEFSRCGQFTSSLVNLIKCLTTPGEALPANI